MKTGNENNLVVSNSLKRENENLRKCLERIVLKKMCYVYNQASRIIF